MPRAQQMSLTPLQSMVDEAIDFMREHEPPEGYMLAFSGGKDSVVLRELARMAGVKATSFYEAVGIDPPEVVRFIKKYHGDTRFLYPKMSMWEGIRAKSPPVIRAEESPGRAKRGAVSRLPGKRLLLSPIFNWQEWHVWYFIEGLSLPYCELYDQGFARIGCTVCPLIVSVGMRKVKQHMERWPGFYKAFEHSVTWWFEHKAGGDKERWPTARAYLEAWYRGFKLESSNNKMQRTANPQGYGTQLCFPAVRTTPAAADFGRYKSRNNENHRMVRLLDVHGCLPCF